jgi:ligand-binding sensor domain-containing protein
MRVNKHYNFPAVAPFLAAAFHFCGYAVVAWGLVLVVAVAALPPHYARAQPSTPGVIQDQAEGTWTNFSVADGLADNSIFALDVTADGHVWVGNAQGVSVRAPGGEWLTLTELGHYAGVDIVPDPDNNQRHWIATYEGGTLLDDNGTPLDQSDDDWKTFRESDGLVKRYVSTLAVDDNGDIWLGTNYIDDEGNEEGYGVSVLDVNGTPFDKSDDTWTTYTASNSNLSHDAIRDITVDDRGVVWLATKSGLSAYDGGAWSTFTTYGAGLADNGVTAIEVANDALWIATQDGVNAFDYNGTLQDTDDDRWATYDKYDGLAADDASCLAIEGNGRIWVGTTWKTNDGEVGAGISVLDANGTPFAPGDDTWATFTTYDGLAHDAVRAVAASGSEAVWVGTKEGVSQIEYGNSPFAGGDNRWTTYESEENLAGNTVYAAAGANASAIWLGTDQGLSLLQHHVTPGNKLDDEWKTYTTEDGLAANGILALTSDDKGRVWIGTAAGLTVLDPGDALDDTWDDEVVTYDSDSGLVNDRVNAIAIDDAGRAWIGCGSYFDGGVNVLELGDYLGYQGDDTWGTFTPLNSDVPDPFVETVAVGMNNEVWVGTHGGAARLDHAGSPFDKSDDSWSVFDTGNSELAFDTVKGIAVDEARNVWFALAMAGINVRSPSGNWYRFTQADGLTYDSVYAVVEDKDGNLWFGTDGGASFLGYGEGVENKEDDVWVTYGGDTLLSTHIRAVAEDALGQVWLGTFGGGASVYSDLEKVYLPLAMRNAW